MGAGQTFLLLETTATVFMAGLPRTMQLLNYPLATPHTPTTEGSA